MFRKSKKEFFSRYSTFLIKGGNIFVYCYVICISLKTISVVILDVLLAKTIPGIYTAKVLYSQQSNAALRFSLSVCITPLEKLKGVETCLPCQHSCLYTYIRHFLCTFSSNCTNRSSTEQDTKPSIRSQNSSFESIS